jgi:hypothetical protein
VRLRMSQLVSAHPPLSAQGYTNSPSDRLPVSVSVRQHVIRTVLAKSEGYDDAQACL